jgi:gamma-glutamyltranspeptidase/glutathione hydrolase
MPPPSSGPLAVMQILGLLQAAQGQAPAVPATAPGTTPWSEAAVLHRFLEASRLAFADRDHHVADPDHVDPPAGHWASLIAPEYLRRRAALIGERAMGVAAPGEPDGAPVTWAPDPGAPAGGTTHLSVADAQGGVVALTSSIEAAFGAKLLSDGGTGLPGGFFLNNQLTDFSFSPRDPEGRPVANRVQPGKRPRSSMAPMLVLDRARGAPVLTLGSALGPIIIPAVARSLLAVGAWQADLQAAFDEPTAANLNGATLLEDAGFSPTLRQALRERGHEVLTLPLGTGLHGLQRVDGGWRGAADPRREGTADGD